MRRFITRGRSAVHRQPWGSLSCAYSLLNFERRDGWCARLYGLHDDGFARAGHPHPIAFNTCFQFPAAAVFLIEGVEGVHEPAHGEGS